MMTAKSTFFNNGNAADLLAGLHSSCFSKGWSKRNFQQLLRQPGTFAQILEEADNPVAFSLYQVAIEEAEILTIGVLPEVRGRSYGHILLQQGEKYLFTKGVIRLLLEVSATNIPAIRLYEKRQFKKIGTRKNYYRESGKKVDAIIMDKKLL
ncbi:MAG: ribosomal protein S18-alanine N-acetyltransferase [Sneathiella sp.]|nr:ribosomal protein S18-alanine N-acetyltransferase [Sneathiella sp.]